MAYRVNYHQLRSMLGSLNHRIGMGYACVHTDERIEIPDAPLNSDGEKPTRYAYNVGMYWVKKTEYPLCYTLFLNTTKEHAMVLTSGPLRKVYDWVDASVSLMRFQQTTREIMMRDQLQKIAGWILDGSTEENPIPANATSLREAIFAEATRPVPFPQYNKQVKPDASVQDYNRKPAELSPMHWMLLQGAWNPGVQYPPPCVEKCGE